MQYKKKFTKSQTILKKTLYIFEAIIMFACLSMFIWIKSMSSSPPMYFKIYCIFLQTQNIQKTMNRCLPSENKNIVFNQNDMCLYISRVTYCVVPKRHVQLLVSRVTYCVLPKRHVLVSRVTYCIFTNTTCACIQDNILCLIKTTCACIQDNIWCYTKATRPCI